MEDDFPDFNSATFQFYTRQFSVVFKAQLTLQFFDWRYAGVIKWEPFWGTSKLDFDQMYGNFEGFPFLTVDGVWGWEFHNLMTPEQCRKNTIIM